MKESPRHFSLSENQGGYETAFSRRWVTPCSPMTDALGFLWGGEAALPPEHITTRGEVLICSCFANSASRELLQQ